MFGLSGLRLYGALGGILLLVGIIAAAVWLVRDRDRLQGVERRALACESAVKASSVLDADTLAFNCPQAIADAATRADRYRSCDSALKVGNLYIVRAACSEQVKHRDAQATALASDVADLTSQLTEARGQLGAAITRAGARAATSARKDARAQNALSTRPPAADGRITCDDRCLRDLTGD